VLERLNPAATGTGDSLPGGNSGPPNTFADQRRAHLCAVLPEGPTSRELPDSPSGALMPALDRGGLVGSVATAAGETGSCR